jgi:hypothetical protein
MFLPLSKNKKEFFWNLMKALAVVDYFPKRLVFFCKRSSFVRKHPHLFYRLISLYMRGILLFKRFILRENRTKKSYANGVSFFQKLPPELWMWAPRRKLFEITPFYKFIVFPREEGFCLRIVKRVKFKLPLKFSLSLFPFNRDRKTKPYLWKVKLKNNFIDSKEVNFKFKDLNLYYQEGGQQKKAKLIKKNLGSELFCGPKNIVEVKYCLPFFGYLPVAYLLVYFNQG